MYVGVSRIKTKMRRSKRKNNRACARGADDQQKRVRESNQNTSTPKTRAQSQTPPKQAVNGPTPRQPVSIYTRQQAEIPMSPSVTFTEPSTSAGINPNDYLRFETNDVHIVQSVHSFLGSHVSQTNRTKIVSGQYIDLAILSENTNSENNDKQVVLIDGVLSTKEKTKQTIHTIEKWTDVFIVYISIYTSAHPEKYQALLKYMHIVRLGASRINGLGWKTYDEQFRLKMGIDPVKSWEIVNQELWLLYMGNTRNSLPDSYKNDKSKTSVNKCYNFNKMGMCDRVPCNYKHVCFSCSGHHPYYTCPNRNTYENVGNHSFRPPFRAPFRARAPTGFNSPGLRGSFRPRAQGQDFRFQSQGQGYTR